MNRTTNIALLTLLACGNAHAQDAATIYGVTLAPGETIIEAYNAPSVVQMPGATVHDPLSQAESYAPPPVEIDRVTGMPRNQEGWSGDNAEPAGIGCFPQGVCTHLN